MPSRLVDHSPTSGGLWKGYCNMITINAQAKHNYRLVVLLTRAQRAALGRLVEQRQESSPLIPVTQSDVVRELIVGADRQVEMGEAAPQDGR